MSKTNFSITRLTVALMAALSFASLGAHAVEGTYPWSSASPGRLNFLVDNDLTVLSVSNERMEFFAKASEVIGSNIFAKIPLSGHQQEEIKKNFVDAHAFRETRSVSYDFDPDAHNPNMGIAHPRRAFFKAEITPLFDARRAPAGFFVKVVPLRVEGRVFLE